MSLSHFSLGIQYSFIQFGKQTKANQKQTFT